MVDKDSLFLIDATGFCYRAFYAVRGLSTSSGQPTNAIYGFVNMLNKILIDNSPEYIAACFDISRDTFRAKKFAEYKIQRSPMPDSLGVQIPFIKQIIAAYGIKILEKAGFEADDIIATVADKLKGKGLRIVVVSSDKDMLQLIEEGIEVFNPYKEQGIIYDSRKIEKELGIAPGQITDIIALMGDAVDNIPGVSGIGEKTAFELIRQWGDLDTLLGKIEQIKQEKIKKLLTDNIDNIRLSRELAVLDRNVDIDISSDELKMTGFNMEELLRIFRQLEFKKVLKDLPRIAAGLGHESPAQGNKKASFRTPAVNLKDSDLKDLRDSIKELYLYGESVPEIIFSGGDKLFTLEEFGVNIKEILEDSRVKKTGFDLKKLKLALNQAGIVLNGIHFDVMVAGYVLDPAVNNTSLADIALEYLNEAADIAGLQAGMEVILRLKPELEKQLIDKSLSKLFSDIEMPLVEVLSEMELNGIKIDLPLLSGLSGNLDITLNKLISDIYRISEEEFNINSPKQLRQILFDKLKLPVVKRSKTGPSTDEEVLRTLAKSHELPEYLLEYRKLSKLKNTYVDALPKLVDPRTGRIHTSFNQTGTETGRLSSSNPNLQNLPIKTDIGSKIRQAVIVSQKEDYLLACDYSQIELRILAHMSKDENLIRAFVDSKDVHRITASLIYGVEEKDVDERMRETAKRVNFGIVYGLTSYGLSKDLNISVEEAQAFIDAYFLRYPRVKEYIDTAVQQAEQTGFVTTILGRRRYIPEINSKNLFMRQLAQRQVVNTPIQGSASDLIKLAMIEIHRQFKAKGFKSRMLLQVHDELVFDAVSSEFDRVVSLVRDIMENVLKLDVPVKITMKKGKNWLEMDEIT